MEWQDLTKDNIEEVKQLYFEYLEENKQKEYMANLITFEEFIKKELIKCKRCENVIYKDSEYCDCCKDELYKI